MIPHYKNFEKKLLQQLVGGKGKHVDITPSVTYNPCFTDYALSKLSKQLIGNSESTVWHDTCKLVWCLSNLNTY